MPCPVKWSGLCQNRWGGVWWSREDPESAVTGTAQLGARAQLQPPSGPGLREQLRTCFALGRLCSRPLRRPQEGGPWGKALCSLHISPGFASAAATRHSLGGANDKNVSSRDSVNERLAVRCGQASSSQGLSPCHVDGCFHPVSPRGRPSMRVCVLLSCPHGTPVILDKAHPRDLFVPE